MEPTRKAMENSGEYMGEVSILTELSLYARSN
jgi:hypothetical protein